MFLTHLSIRIHSALSKVSLCGTLQVGKWNDLFISPDTKSGTRNLQTE